MNMKFVKIEIEVALPDDFSESAVDERIAEVFIGLCGEVLESQEFIISSEPSYY